MNAHISRCVPNIIVMRTLETRNSCLPRKEKTCDVTLRQREPDVRPARCYRAKNSISVARRCLPFLAFAMLEKSGSRLPHGGECAGHAVCHDFQPADLYFLRSCQWDTFLDLFKSPTFKGQALYRRPMFVLPSHVSPCTLSIHRPIRGNRASLQELRPVLRSTSRKNFLLKYNFIIYIRKL